MRIDKNDIKFENFVPKSFKQIEDEKRAYIFEKIMKKDYLNKCIDVNNINKTKK